MSWGEAGGRPDGGQIQAVVEGRPCEAAVGRSCLEVVVVVREVVRVGDLRRRRDHVGRRDEALEVPSYPVAVGRPSSAFHSGHSQARPSSFPVAARGHVEVVAREAFGRQVP